MSVKMGTGSFQALALGAVALPMAWLSATMPAANPAATPAGTAEHTAESIAGRQDIKPHAGMLRFPAVSRSHIVFVYANDLWLVPRAGGVATPLVSPPGPEIMPRFSPDGQTIAFVGNYEGNRDIYTIPVEGGLAHRVTHHPGSELLTDWAPDGRLIFTTNGFAGIGRQQQLFAVDPEGGLPEQLPVPYGAAGAISPDGQWLAYTPHNRDFRTWKRYRGGFASNIWLFNLNDHTSQQITDWEGTDTIPMWHGETIYYLSDNGEEARLNIWSYNTRTNRRAQITRFEDFDIKFPSIGPGPNGEGEIVFQYGPELYLLNLATRQSRPVEVRIPGDRPLLRAQQIDASNFIQSWNISSTGQRAVVQARGDIWTLPAQHGTPRNLTRTNGVAERMPAWSPDGRWIAYYSDATGEYELYVTQSDGRGETRQLTEGSETYYFEPHWSPDSAWILYAEKNGDMHLLHVESGEHRIMDTDHWAWDYTPRDFSWSHDSGWIAYSRSTDHSPMNAIFLYNVAEDTVHQVTTGMFNDALPAFDRKGDYLYFRSHRSFSPNYSDIDSSFIYNESAVLLAVPLRKDMASPWAPKIDEEKFDDAKPDAEPSDADDADDQPADQPAADPVSGLWTCELRGDALPEPVIPATMTLALGANNTVTGNVQSMAGNATFNGTYNPATRELTGTIMTEIGLDLILSATINNGSLEGRMQSDMGEITITGRRTATDGQAATQDDAEASDDPASTDEPLRIDLDGFERRAMILPVTPGGFRQLAVNDRNQLIYGRTSSRSGGQTGIQLFDITSDTREERLIAAGATNFAMSADGKQLLVIRGSRASIQPAQPGSSARNVPTNGMMVMVNPREEWQQIYVDAWRHMRDFFYDPGMHGVDWEAVRDQYALMLQDANNREDVSFIIGELISELNAGHTYYGGGDTESQPSVNVGMLGVDFEVHDGAYRIAAIHEGGPWDADARGPLSQPGVDVSVGDYLLAVDGVPMDMSRDPWAAFIDKAGRTVTLTVSSQPELNGEAREVIVETLNSEANLRYRAWIERNRAYVEEVSGGRIGYIFVPDTGVNGQTNLFRQFYGQRHLDALIIDERWNGGGQIPTRFVELLNRPRTNYWARRDGRDWNWPPDSHQGPKTMLINGPSGSGGDAFPYYFKQAGLGKLIGMRTWGGLIGLHGNPSLIDGGSVRVPTFGFYETDGTWGIEGHGVDPDIEVIDDPALMQDGGDPQLDAAIRHLLEELERNAYTPPARPAYPDRSGFGIAPEDR